MKYRSHQHFLRCSQSDIVLVVSLQLKPEIKIIYIFTYIGTIIKNINIEKLKIAQITITGITIVLKTDSKNTINVSRRRTSSLFL